MGEGSAWLRKALSRVDNTHPSPEVAELLLHLGQVESFRGNKEKGVSYIQHSQEMYQRLSDRRGYAWATGHLAMTTSSGEKTRDTFAESIAILRQLGTDKDLAFILWNWGQYELYLGDRLESALSLLAESADLYGKMECYWQALVQVDLGDVYRRLGQVEQARCLIKKGLAVTREVGDLWAFMLTLELLSDLEVNEARNFDDLHRAEAALLECLEISSKFGMNYSFRFYVKLGRVARRQQNYLLAFERLQAAIATVADFESIIGKNVMGIFMASGFGLCLFELAKIEVNLDRTIQSTTLLGILQAQRDAVKFLWNDIEPKEFEFLAAEVRTHMGEEAFQAAWEKGRGMTTKQSIQYLLGEYE